MELMKRKRLATVEEAILVYLKDFTRYREEIDVPLAITQMGISRDLGIRRSHVSISLDSARQKDLIEERTLHIIGEARRRKSYFLTHEGMAKALSLETGFFAQEITACLKDGQSFKGNLKELTENIESSISLARLIIHTYEGEVKLNELSSQDELPARQLAIPHVPLLFGREEETEAIHHVLDGSVSVMSITGIAGIGKTAMLAHIMETSPHRSETLWIDIGEWSSVRNISGHMANYLDAHSSPRLKRYLKAHEILDMADIHDILLDLDARMILIFDDIHNSSPKILKFFNMLISSALTSDKILVFLLGRSRPDIVNNYLQNSTKGVFGLDLVGISEDSSIELLRARGFSDNNSLTIAQRSDGHPLYLTLVKDLGPASPDNIEEKLAKEIFDHLSEEEKTIMGRLSVFRESVDPEAIVQEDRDFDILDGLIKQSIVIDDGGWTTHGLLRKFFYERQVKVTQLSSHEIAAEYYSTRPMVSDRVEETHHLIRADDLETALYLLKTEGGDWLKQGYQDEILSIFEEISSARIGDEGSYELKFLAGMAHMQIGNWTQSLDLFTASLTISRDLNDPRKVARTLKQLGALQYHRGNLDEAHALLSEALDLVPDHIHDKDHDLLRSEIDNALGVIFWKLGQIEKAVKAYNEDLSISRQNNNHEGIVRALNNLGIIMSQQGDYDDALQYYAEGIELAERMNDHKLVCILYSNIADSYKLKGSSTEAQRFYERCIELSGDLGFKWQIAESYRGLADIVPNKREHYLKQALTMFERLGASEDARSVRAMIEDG